MNADIDLSVLYPAALAHAKAFADAYIVHNVYGALASGVAAIGMLAGASVRGESYLSYRRQTRYRGGLVCTAKRERHWGVDDRAGIFCRLTEPALARLREPHVLEVRLDTGEYGLMAVSRLVYARTRTGDRLPRRFARTVRRRALFIV